MVKAFLKDPAYLRHLKGKKGGDYFGIVTNWLAGIRSRQPPACIITLIRRL